eukprot:4874927-Pyramimonas_sp.AAC.2
MGSQDSRRESPILVASGLRSLSPRKLLVPVWSPSSHFRLGDTTDTAWTRYMTLQDDKPTNAQNLR